MTVVRAAAGLLRTGGVDALSTRAVAAAAGVQPPVIYRQFGNKEGLLDAVSTFVFDEYLRQKRHVVATSVDPLHDLQTLWDLNVEFGMTYPDCYVLGYVRPGQTSVATRGAKTIQLLVELLNRLDEQGRLRVSVERATALVCSAAIGVVVTLIPVPPEERDLRMSHLARQNALAAILREETGPGPGDATACLTHDGTRSTSNSRRWGGGMAAV
jgi:AcrR family transcriptional regulator